MNARLALLLGSLYIAQGLPSGFFAHALPALLREQGVSLTLISLAKLLALPWFLKFLWAPYVDRTGRGRASHYRSWILAMQTVALLVVSTLSLLDPAHWLGAQLPLFLLVALLVNTCLATHDIATDALAVKLLPPADRGPGSSLQVAGYKLGMLVGGNGLLLVMGSLGLQDGFRWLALGLLLLALPVLLFREPVTSHADAPAPVAPQPPWLAWRPLLALPGMTLWLPVLLTYKIGDALASSMIRPLLVDAGFTLERIGQVGMAATLAGILAAFAGGLCERWLGGWRALFWFGLLQALGLAAWALVPLGWQDASSVYAIALFEQMADAMSTVALFAAMMGFCRRDHEGGDYTVQMSLFMVVSGSVGLAGGALAEALGSPAFFLTTGVASLLNLGWVWRGWRVSAQARPGHPA